MAWVEHQCKTCSTILCYEQKTNARIYCAPCRKVAIRLSNRISLRVRRSRYGRLSFRQYKALEAQP
jgi:hypothetical protein